MEPFPLNNALTENDFDLLRHRCSRIIAAANNLLISLAATRVPCLFGPTSGGALKMTMACSDTYRFFRKMPG